MPTIDSALSELVEAAVAKAIPKAIERMIPAIVAAVKGAQAHKPHWGSREEAAKHRGTGLDEVDARIADGTLRSKKAGKEPDPEKRKPDKLGRPWIDRRRVLVWIEGEQAAKRARAQ